MNFTIAFAMVAAVSLTVALLFAALPPVLAGAALLIAVLATGATIANDIANP